MNNSHDSCEPPRPRAQDFSQHDISHRLSPLTRSAVPSAEEHRLLQLLDAIESQWRSGSTPQALQVLEAEPGFLSFPLLAAELAFSEFDQRQRRGETIVVSTFCEQFPISCRPALDKLIQAQAELATQRLSAIAPTSPQSPPLPQPIPWPTLHETWQGYRLMRELGRGGLARVYLAAELQAGERSVVVKLTPESTHGGDLQAILLHDSLMPLLTMRHDPATGIYGLVMPYWAQATLQDLVVARGEFGLRDRLVPADLILRVARTKCGSQFPDVPHDPPPPRCRNYGQAVAHFASRLTAALQSMHARGIAHLDLKPSNILISPNGRPLIIDFNLSAPVDQCVRSLGGTIPYMPPESLHSLELQRVDPRLDIFSLGVIFFELLVGKLPFGLPTPNTSSLEQVQQMLRLQNESPDPVRRLGIQLPSAWKYVLRHTLALDQQQRFATAAELQVALLELTRNPPQSWLLGCRRWFMERLTGKN